MKRGNISISTFGDAMIKVKRCIFFLCLCFLLIPNTSGAKSLGVSVGVNYSKIDAAGTSQPLGYVLGWGAEWGLSRSLKLESEINLVYRQTEMWNKIRSSYPGYVRLADFKVEQVFVQIPLMIKLPVPYTCSRLKFYMGPSLMFGVYDNVTSKSHKTIFDPYESDGYYHGHVDVRTIEDPGIVKPILDSSTVGYICGLDWNVLDMSIGLRYTHSTLRQPDAIEFNMGLHTISLIVGL